MQIRAALLLLLLLPLSADAAVHLVDCGGGGDYISMQAAVDVAATGDTILVAPCVYEEQVYVSGKRLTIIGSGPDVTELRWTGPEPTFLILDMPSEIGRCFRLTDIAITHVPSGIRAIEWDERRVCLDGCCVNGRVYGGYPEQMGYVGAGVSIDESLLTHLVVYGGGNSSVINSSRVDTAGIGGGGPNDWEVYDHYLDSHGNEYGRLRCGAAALELVDDVIGELSSNGNLYCDAVSCAIGSLDLWSGWNVDLVECRIEQNVYLHGSVSVHTTIPAIAMSGCLVGAGVLVEIPWWTPDSGLVQVNMTHNTILGDMHQSWNVHDDVSVLFEVMDNIVMGSTDIDLDGAYALPRVHHNDFVAGFSYQGTYPDSIHSNFSAPPLFCAPELGDYTLQACSPCAGTAHDDTDIGAFGVGCECIAPIVPMSWGTIKAMFRAGQPSN